MKYASEVIGLLAAHPGRRFRMRQIIRHVQPKATAKELPIIRTGVWRVLQALEESGQVRIERPETNGAPAEYWWETITSRPENHFRNPYNNGRALAP